MDETIACPGCRSHLMLPPMPAGQTVQCPRCERVFEPFLQRPNVPAPTSSRRNRYDDDIADPIPATRPLRPGPLVEQWKAVAAQIALAASILSFAMQIYVHYERIELIETQAQLHNRGELRIFNPNEQEMQLFHQFHQWQILAQWSSVIDRWTFWIAAVAFLVWLYRATANVRLLQVDAFEPTPWKAVLSFFVPILNLSWPHSVVQDVWRSSDPHTTGTPLSWTQVPRQSFIFAWWFLFLAFALLSFISNRFAQNGLAFDGGDPRFLAAPHAQSFASFMAILASVSIIVAGLLLIIIIRSIVDRQRERYARLYEELA